MSMEHLWNDTDRGEELDPVPLCSQIPHLAWDWTWFSMVSGSQLTTWAVAWPQVKVDWS